MFRKKIYGQSRVDRCPFCNKHATVKNQQGVPVCSAHKDKKLPDLKCACGEWLDIREGKWGPYFHCMNCGNISFAKAMEMCPILDEKEEAENTEKSANKEKKEITVTAEELDFLY